MSNLEGKDQSKDILQKITPEIKAEMESIWFTADIHHGHPKIIDICNRPVFLDQNVLAAFSLEDRNLKNKIYKELLDKAHNEWLIKEVINKWVKKRDTIFFIGDLSMAKREEAEKFIDRLNGNKFLIEGNHDRNILHSSTRFSQITQIKDFTFSRDGLNIHIVLCHYPFVSWNRKPHGSWHVHGLPWNLYGHVHGRFRNDGLSFDVGIDNPELLTFTGGVYRPLNLFEIVKIMEERRKFIEDEMTRSEHGICA
mgnify:FL=1